MSQMILQRCTAVARHLPTRTDTPYKKAIFQTRFDLQERTMDAAVPLPPHGMLHMLNIRLQLLPQAHVRAHARWLAWSYVRRTSNYINARFIVRLLDSSYDAVALSYNTRFCCTTNAPGRKTYHTIHYISLHNGRLLALQHVRAFVRAFFSCEHS